MRVPGLNLLEAAAPRTPTADDLLSGLRDLCGYVENGSDCTVKIYQDDATRSWIVVVGPSSNWYHDTSFTGALETAIAGEAAKR